MHRATCLSHFKSRFVNLREALGESRAGSHQGVQAMGMIEGRGRSPAYGTLFAPLLLREGKECLCPEKPSSSRTILTLSILDEHGRVDTRLMPDLAEDELRHLHRIMLLSRRCDERLLSLPRQGRMGTFAPGKGQKAAQMGAVAPLQQEDWRVPSLRETAAAL